ncbi:MAG: hypothetical protein AMXMBFR64_35870 [Myxococcales bacterium]
MFEAFEKQEAPSGRGRWTVAGTLSAAALALVAIGASWLASQAEHVVPEDEIQVAFLPLPPEPVSAPEAPEPPPEAPKVPEPPPPAPEAAAVEPPPPRPAARRIAAPPKELPKGRLKEGDPSAPRAKATTEGSVDGEVGGTGEGEAAEAAEGVVEAPTDDAAPPSDTPKVEVSSRAPREPVFLPDDATPARPRRANTLPQYPAEARVAGLEGVVVVRFVVTAEGTVSELTVVSGEEPFVAATVAAVSTWTFDPATVGGQPAPAWRVVKIPFRLRA